MRLPSPTEFYRRSFGIDDPYPYQESLYQAFFNWDGWEEFLALVQVPNGKGRGEAVLAPFLAQFLAGRRQNAPRLLYVLPARSACHLVADRFQKYVREFRAQWPNVPELSVQVYQVAPPAGPSLYGDIVVTTLDQFIDAFVRSYRQLGRHVDLPAGAIAQSLVAFDEAQGHSTFTWPLLRALVEILGTARVPQVIMTANLVPALQSDLISQEPRLNAKPPVVILTDSWGQADAPLHPVCYPGPMVEGDRLSPDAEAALRRLPSGARSLLVCNTVKAAQKTFLAVRDAGICAEPPVLLHSAFAESDMRRQLGRAVDLLGPDGRGGVVVSSPMCEVGIDISADLLLTELAPAYSLLPRFVRYRRWSTPAGPKGILLFQGEGAYAPEHVAATLKWLRSNPGRDLGDHKTAHEFCSAVDHQISNAETAEALQELFDGTVYADTRPWRLHTHDGYSVHLWVPGESSLPFTDRLVTIPYPEAKKAAPLLSFSGSYARLQWAGDAPDMAAKGQEGLGASPQLLHPGNGWAVHEEHQLCPFGTYVLPPQQYHAELGVLLSDLVRQPW